MNAITDRILQGFEVFTTYFGDSSTVFISFVGVAFGLLVLSFAFVISNVTDASRRRIRSAVQDDISDFKSKNNRAKKIENSVAPFQSLVLPNSNKERNAVKKRLVSAGYRNDSAISVYYFLKLVLALAFGIIALYVTTYFPALTTIKIVLTASMAAFVGSIIPSYILDKKVNARKKRIINAFPDMLDMLVACSEAGLGLNAALQRVSIEIEPSFPDLGEELELVNAEMLAGIERTKALRGLADRTDIPDIQGFVSMLSQSVRFGTGIAETLRIYADDFRDRRMQRAEELAAKVGTKLLFPLVLCFFPSFFLVAVGPAAIAITKAFQ